VCPVKKHVFLQGRLYKSNVVFYQVYTGGRDIIITYISANTIKYGMIVMFVNIKNCFIAETNDNDNQKKAHKNFPCYGCKNCYDDRTCVIQHEVQNCDSWMERKDEILTPGWSIFDQNGDLRQDV
jgi:hypothetical protein